MKKIIVSISLIAPSVALAQTDAFSILSVFENLLRWIPRLLIALGFIYFIWGVIKYIISTDSDDKEKAKKAVVNGVLGLFLVFSIWGIIGVIQSTFGVMGGGNASDSMPSVLGDY